MNTPHRLRFVPIALALLLGFSACSAPVSSGSLPTSQALAASPDSLVFIPIAGQYNGTVADSARGKGKVVLQLAQSVSSAGGSMNQTYGTTMVSGVISASLSGTSLNGNEVFLGSTPCTFSVSAKYNPKNAVLSGSYKAVSRCKGQSGTFKLKEQCFYVTPSASADIERPNNVTVRPC
jgi:hypothetical protein